MFGIFKKKSKVDKLYDKYEKLMKESHTLSTSSRIASDSKAAEANRVLLEIDAIEKK